MSFDLILGYHSIHHALNNSKRSGFELFSTKDGMAKYQSKYQKRVEFIECSKQDIQKKYQAVCSELGLKNSKLQGEIFLKVNQLEELGNAFLYNLVEKKEDIKLMALDRVTDIHNAAAILRTNAFYNTDGLIISQKSSFKFTPSFFKISSGGFEHVPIIRTPNLAKTLKNLNSKNVDVVGLSEEVDSTEFKKSNRWCLVMGSEELGLSHAVERSLSSHIKLEAVGEINSLNVSIASAVALEKFCV